MTVPEFPELSRLGAYSAQEVYSTDDVQAIVEYAGAVCRPLSYKKTLTTEPLLTLLFLSEELMFSW